MTDSRANDTNSEMTTTTECNETVDPATRDDLLEDCKHRCQTCGRCGPGAGGLAALHVHHLRRDPDDMEEHDRANLTVLCRSCHSWHHQRTPPDEAPFELTDDDRTVLLPHDIELLQLLAEMGPATTGDLTAQLSVELTVTAVRERLWVLMGLDNMVETRDKQIVDQDPDTGEWGLVGQIATSARGRIPSDPHVLLQRIQDEYVRQALDRGCERGTVTAAFGVSRRTTFYAQKRAYAYDFPLDAIGRRSGGRPPTDGDAETTATNDAAGADGSPTPAERPQQRRDTAADGAGEQPAGTDTAGDGGTDESAATRLAQPADGDGEAGGRDADALRGHVQQAIAALQAIDAAL